MALLELRDALLCARDTAAESVASALQHLWQYGVKEHSAGVRAWRGRIFGAAAAISGAALRTVQAQIFFRATQDEGGSRVRVSRAIYQFSTSSIPPSPVL